jgi:hypothetical protein
VGGGGYYEEEGGKRVGGTGKKRSARRRKRGKPAGQPDSTLMDEAVVLRIARILGASTPRGMNRVEQVLRLHGPDVVWKAAAQLATDGMPRAKWRAFLEYRARNLKADST